MRINLRSLLIFFLVLYGIARTPPSTTPSALTRSSAT